MVAARQGAGRRLAVAAHPLAADAGLATMLRGGNAVDAAIAAAAAAVVVEPVSCGLGSDAFVLVRRGGLVHALNASGRSPLQPLPEQFGTPLPQLGWKAVTVPGAVSAWSELSSRFGRLPFAELLEPAIALAENGYEVTPVVSRVWRGLLASCRRLPDVMACFFAEHPRGPEPGQRVHLPALARSLRSLAGSAGRSLYEGELAEALVRHSESAGGPFRLADLRAHRCDWVSPLVSRYRGATLHEMPPNSIGAAASVALAVLERLGACDVRDRAAKVHLQIEAMRAAVDQVGSRLADPAAMREPPEAWLDPANIAMLAARVDRERASAPAQDLPSPSGGTTYLATADGDGTAVSYIQSSGAGFGSGLVVPGTGIALQSRTCGFDARPGHPNAFAAHKRPLHSNCPAMLELEDGSVLSFGLMGWTMQVQAHVQFVGHVVDDRLAPQAVLDAPRWRIAAEEPALLLEPALAAQVGAALAERGHRIVQTERWMPASTPFGSHLMFGGASLLKARDGGPHEGATDPRRDGAAAAA